MKKHYFLTILCISIAFVLGGFLTSQNRAKEAGESLSEAEETEAEPPSQIVSFNKERDIILESYNDPELREKALNFFVDLTDSREVSIVVLDNAVIYNIPPALAFSLCAEESSYNPQAFNRNKNGSVDRGLFQLNSASFPDLKISEFYSPTVNARFGLAHLRWCLDTAGTEVAGLAMYNAGMTRVHAQGTPKHTLDYVSRILKRQRTIEELFLAEYTNFVQIEIAEKPQKPPFRLSLLTPLGGR